jgi:AcrR family transcriptional regulator
MTRASYHHGNLQEALLSAARSLVEQHGHDGLSLRGVAREAGVSQAAPYHHFPNKEALLAAVAHQGYGELIQRMDQHTDGLVDPGEHLDAMGRAYIAFGLAHPRVYALMFSDTCPAERHPDLQVHGQQAFMRLVDAVMRGQASGHFRATDPMPLAVSVWGTVHGMVALMQNKLTDGKELQGVQMSHEQMVEATMRFVRSALEPR